MPCLLSSVCISYSAAFVLKNGGFALMCLLTQRTPCRRKGRRGDVVITRVCRIFGAPLRTFAAPFAAFVLKNGGLALMCLLTQRTPCRRKGHRGDVVITRVCRSFGAPLRTFAAPFAAFVLKNGGLA